MLVDFHPEATEELTESADWYADRSSVAARNFLVAVDVAITSITADPERFIYIDDRHQSCGVFKFPFQLVFRHDGERIHIVAVAHAKRRLSRAEMEQRFVFTSLRSRTRNDVGDIGEVGSADGRPTWFCRP